MDESGLLNLIGRIYAAPGDPCAWHGLTLDLAAAFGAAHTHIVVSDESGRVRCDFVTEARAGDEYAAHYALLDTAVHRLRRGPDGKAAAERDLMTADELKTCPVHQELLPKFGAAHRLWAKTRMDSASTYNSAIIRSARQGAFEASSYRVLELLHPHIERAMRLHLVLAEARAAAASLEAGLDTLATGIAALDAAGTVLFANRAARALLNARNAVQLDRGRLAASKPSDDAKLQAVLARALGSCGPAQGGGIALERPDASGLIVRAVPVAASADVLAPRAAAVLVFRDLGPSACADPASLAILGLRPAEIRCLTALMAGSSLEEYASQAGLSHHTARSMLKTMFARTGTHRQSSLVALAMQAGVP